MGYKVFINEDGKEFDRLRDAKDLVYSYYCVVEGEYIIMKKDKISKKGKLIREDKLIKSEEKPNLKFRKC